MQTTQAGRTAGALPKGCPGLDAVGQFWNIAKRILAGSEHYAFEDMCREISGYPRTCRRRSGMVRYLFGRIEVTPNP